MTYIVVMNLILPYCPSSFTLVEKCPVYEASFPFLLFSFFLFPFFFFVVPVKLMRIFSFNVSC